MLFRYESQIRTNISCAFCEFVGCEDLNVGLPVAVVLVVEERGEAEGTEGAVRLGGMAVDCGEMEIRLEGRVDGRIVGRVEGEELTASRSRNQM